MRVRASARGPSGTAGVLGGDKDRYEVTIPAGGLLANIVPGARVTITYGPSKDRDKYTATITSKPLWIAAL